MPILFSSGIKDYGSDLEKSKVKFYVSEVWLNVEIMRQKIDILIIASILNCYTSFEIHI